MTNLIPSPVCSRSITFAHAVLLMRHLPHPACVNRIAIVTLSVCKILHRMLFDREDTICWACNRAVSACRRAATADPGLLAPPASPFRNAGAWGCTGILLGRCKAGGRAVAPARGAAAADVFGCHRAGGASAMHAAHANWSHSAVPFHQLFQPPTGSSTPRCD